MRRLQIQRGRAPLAHPGAGGAEAVGEAGPFRGSGEAHHLRRQVGRVLQHVTQHFGQRFACAGGNRCGGGQCGDDLRRLEHDPVGAEHGLEDLARVELGLADGQPARSALAERGLRHGPVVAPVGVGIGEKRRVAVDDAHPGHADLGAELLGPCIHGDAPAAALAFPLEMHAVEVEREAGDRRVVAYVGGLEFVDDGLEMQRPAPDEELALHLSQAAVLHHAGEVGHVVGLQRRVAAASEDQVAVQHAVLDGPGRQHAGFEPMLRPQHI